MVRTPIFRWPPLALLLVCGGRGRCPADPFREEQGPVSRSSNGSSSRRTILTSTSATAGSPSRIHRRGGRIRLRLDQPVVQLPDGQPIPLIVYNSHNDFQQTNVIDEYMEEGIGGVTELFKNRVVVPFEGDYKKFRHVIHHELVHAVMNDMFYGGSIQSIISNNISLQLPLWFNEGWRNTRRSSWDTNSDMFLRDATVHEYLSRDQPAERVFCLPRRAVGLVVHRPQIRGTEDRGDSEPHQEHAERGGGIQGSASASGSRSSPSGGRRTRRCCTGPMSPNGRNRPTTPAG